MTDLERIDGLQRHINLVRENCRILANHLISESPMQLDRDMARMLIKLGEIHDNSKYAGIEWEFLTGVNTTNRAGLKYAIEHHESQNPHHPEYWGTIALMPYIYLME